MGTQFEKDGKSLSPWAYRLGNVEPQRDGDFLIRIYYNQAETVDDLDKPATKVFAVVRGETEEQCYARGNAIFGLCCAGEFENY